MSEFVPVKFDMLASTLVQKKICACASGGYYMAMAADTIVAENLTLTGSIGVVTGEFGCSQL